jgi:hypothetical protein
VEQVHLRWCDGEAVPAAAVKLYKAWWGMQQQEGLVSLAMYV